MYATVQNVFVFFFFTLTKNSHVYEPQKEEVLKAVANCQRIGFHSRLAAFHEGLSPVHCGRAITPL